MDKKQAVKLISEIFESPFDKTSFSSFVRNLLNHVDDDGFSPRTGTYIPDSFMPYIHSLERVGKYMDKKNRVDILIVHLKKETSLERARTMQRNFVAGYLQGKYGSTEEKDAALVAFVSANPDDWRFSLVKMEYRFKEDKGSVKVKEEFTPARRWSFLVGANEGSHTAQSQLMPILADDENNPTLAELEEAFSIEKVSDEFFGEYRRLFISVKEALDDALLTDASLTLEFETKNVNSVDFAKKLLGQIIFLYYLQKKGWFGVPKKGKWGEGSKNFLREIFEKKHSDYENFFNDILEPLFYQALRTDRSYNSHYYDRFDCKIPFLNGGLFDPMGNYDWVETDICLPNALFSNEKRVSASDKGDGILDVFDRYNFTVREDEPFEKEVAIDPELLGKAYEKFNAIRPDNFDEYKAALKDGKKGSESKFNKKFGVYYTPREIVHYMCQQSLIQYLHTELNAPAGEEIATAQKEEAGFAMTISKEDIEMLILHGERIRENDARVVAEGRETRDYKFEIPESIRLNAARVDEKLATVKVCDPAVGSGAFPVGMMNEIVKAREVLSIYPQTSEVSIYTFKRECIENSLYGVDIDPGAVEIAKLRLWLSLVVDEEDIHNIKPLPNLDYKLMRGNSLLGLPDGVLLNTEKLQELEERKKTYFDETNPSEKDDLRQEINRLFEELVESARQFDPTLREVNFDFRTHFSEVFQGDRGFHIIIANPPYIFTRGAKFSQDFKKHIAKKYFSLLTTKHKKTKSNQSGKINLFALFILEGILNCQAMGTANYIVPNTLLRTTTYDLIRKYILENTQVEEIIDLGSGVFDNVTASTIIIRLSKNKPTNHRVKILTDISNIENQNYVVSEVEQQQFLGNVSYTINLFADKAIYDFIARISNNRKVLGEFCDDIIEGIVAHKHLIKDRPDTNSMPLVEGKTIGRYVLKKINKNIVWNKKEIHRTRPDYLWAAPKKIIIQRISGGANPLTATIDTHKHKTFASVNNLLLKEKYSGLYEFFLALLNSKLLNWFYANNFSNNSKLTVNISKTFLEKLPIELGNDIQKEKLTHLVGQVLSAKRTNPEADTSELEAQIDALVYELYGLTEEEIAIVVGREVDSSAQSSAKPAKKKVKAPVVSVKAVEEKAAPVKEKVPASDYGLYKCSECGGFFAGYEKDEHVSKLHLGQDVEWLKMGGG
jgi:hypothetical protein